MSTICSCPQKYNSFIQHSNGINPIYNYNYNQFGKTNLNYNKYPENSNNNNKIQRVSRYMGKRKRVINQKEKMPRNQEFNLYHNNNQPIKILQNNKNKSIPVNFNPNTTVIPPIRREKEEHYTLNYGSNLNNKKNVIRNPSQTPSIKFSNICNNNVGEKYQNNISTIKFEDSKIEMKPIYINHSKKEEPKVNIKYRNESVFTKTTIYNVLNNNVERTFKFRSGCIGLSNLGNTCYFNAAIQNLKNIYLLTLYLLQNYSQFNKNEFAYNYCELLKNLINQDIYQWYEPRKLYNKLAEKAPIFRYGEQSDSNFCVIYILNILEKETKIYLGQRPFEKIQIISNYFNPEEKRIFSVFMKNFYEKRNSCIVDIFYGLQEDIFKCNYCNYSKYTFQGFSVLNLSIVKSNYIYINSLTECINYYMQIQNHYNESGFSCPNCKGCNISTNARIISLPKTLIINFKRVGDGNHYNHNVQIPEELPLKNLVSDEIYEYELIGCIKHYGGGTSGHNFAICKNFFDGKWYEYNDSRVLDIWNTNHIRGNKIDFSNSFMFFYIKKNFKISDYEKKLIIDLANKFH